MDFRKDFVSSGTQAVDSDYESPADTSGLIVSQVRIHKLKLYLWGQIDEIPILIIFLLRYPL